MLRPAVKAAAPVEGFHQHRSQFPAAPGEHRLQRAGESVVIGIADPAVLDLLAQVLLALPELGQGGLAGPLEGRMGLGHKIRYAGGDRQGSPPSPLPQHLSALAHHLFAKAGDRGHILQGFPGQADHEIQLDLGPAGGYRFRYGI